MLRRADSAQGFGNAPSLQRLIDAGAIPLGKANLHELASGATCVHSLAPPGSVHNPHAPTHIASGSSGGNAAAIAAGIVACGLGTDTGGSLRIPATLTGIVGFRPSHHPPSRNCRYDSRDVLPISLRHDTVGPMARTVADIRLLDGVLGGTPRHAPPPLREVRLGIADWFWSALLDEARPPLHRALARLADAGVELVDIDLHRLGELNIRVSPVINLHEPLTAIPRFLQAYGAHEEQRRMRLEEIVAQVACDDIRALFERTLARERTDSYPAALRHGETLTAYLQHCIASHRLDALCLPTTLLAARPLVTPDGERLMIDGCQTSRFEAYIRNTTPLSSAGLPALSLPAGTTDAGLPVGLELCAQIGDDDRLLAFAASVEALLEAPPKVDPASLAEELERLGPS
ncbi:amidase family protein [Billgrantia endophytica]|uniref:amidase family protein n=1 Tax=Billgrantia endophytica TaxID=2033802 RepID=UPI0023E7770B|nr:amidase family protein [Halomonas endophytica]